MDETYVTIYGFLILDQNLVHKMNECMQIFG